MAGINAKVGGSKNRVSQRLMVEKQLPSSKARVITLEEGKWRWTANLTEWPIEGMAQSTITRLEERISRRQERHGQKNINVRDKTGQVA